MNLFDVYPLYNVTPTKANGMYIYDDKNEKYLDFFKICLKEDGKIGIIVNFLAMLELVKDSLITLIQSEDFGQIHLSAKEEIH